MNEHDSERIAGLLEADGMFRTEEVAEAEVVVLNTCAIRENADNRLYGHLGHLRADKRRNPRLRIVVAGCLAQKDREIVQRRAPWVDVVVGTHALPGLLDLLRRAEDEGPQMDVREFTEVFPSALPAAPERSHSAWVSIAVGCDNRCTFCIVPLVRGPQRSRPTDDILAEVDALAAGGVVEVTLLGQNVNTYGRDVTARIPEGAPRFGELLRAVNEVPGIRRIRFTSPHPHDFGEDVVAALAESENVCEHIHFPLQSGSDRVLRAMRRSYRRERYLSWLERIREAVPGIGVSTDIIVGFPGETEEDFEATLDVVRRARFDSAYTFRYSPRPGTLAGTMSEQVPPGAVQERFQRLVELQEAISLEKARAEIGSAHEILIEGQGRKGGAQGRTRTNRVVHVDGRFAPGTFLDVRIVRAAPHHLAGEVMETAATGAPRASAAGTSPAATAAAR
jgi:tRNA-2-methylthio-N6-dimethylallyladenosine synthase